jgi:hypothetical protein
VREKRGRYDMTEIGDGKTIGMEVKEKETDNASNREIKGKKVCKKLVLVTVCV